MNQQTWLVSILVLGALVAAGRTHAQNLIVTNDIVLWLRADMGVTTNGSGNVTQWNDQSGNGFHATQSTAANQPLYVASEPTIGGKPTLRFDGVSDWMSEATFNALNGTTEYTAYVVARTTATGPNQFAFMTVADAARLYSLQVSGGAVATSTGGDAQGGNSWGEYSVSSSFTNAHKVHEALYDGAGASSADRLKVFLNAQQQTLSFPGFPIPSSLVTSGAGYAIGARSGGTDAFWSGDIAEIILYDNALTDAERLGVRSYIGDKYSIGGIPEPSAVALLSLSGLFLLWRKRRG